MPAPSSPGVLRIVAVNSPLACFASRLGGDLVEVELLPPPDVDPAYWSPDAAAVARMQEADLILLNGAGHERWRRRVSLPRAKVVDTSAGFRDQLIETEGVTHSHGLAGEHSHKGTAFTIWIDPALAVEQAEAIRAALIAALPDDAERINAASVGLIAELQEIDADLEGAIHGQQGLPILFSHPVYQYLEQRFALNGRSLHWEPAEMPEDSEWSLLATLLREHPARWMIWEEEPMEEIRDRLRELGVETVLFRPAGNVPGEPEVWLEVMRRNVAELARVYE